MPVPNSIPHQHPSRPSHRPLLRAEMSTAKSKGARLRGERARDRAGRGSHSPHPRRARPRTRSAATSLSGSRARFPFVDTDLCADKITEGGRGRGEERRSVPWERTERHRGESASVGGRTRVPGTCVGHEMSRDGFLAQRAFSRWRCSLESSSFASLSYDSRTHHTGSRTPLPLPRSSFLCPHTNSFHLDIHDPANPAGCHKQRILQRVPLIRSPFQLVWTSQELQIPILSLQVNSQFSLLCLRSCSPVCVPSWLKYITKLAISLTRRHTQPQAVARVPPSTRPAVAPAPDSLLSMRICARCGQNSRWRAGGGGKRSAPWKHRD
ncbi:hypothetical protein DFH07DRAFT_120580 [Mycena maculata]|uniref:Uncharacterized protein n=1 Tax=Mycena maculata TaxID=230809 RepID=A0AAD7JY39_9AGAR|nr:hypothetical protein DFH07DRAFT_120580 [Mycena maculata]